MNRAFRSGWLLPLLLIAGVLAACGATQPGASAPTAAPSPPTASAPTTIPAPTTTGVIVEKTVFVGPEMVDCTGVGQQKCLQIKQNPNDEYTLFYSTIEGFTFEPGFEYELVVREETVANPPADASSLKWILVKEVSKKQVDASAMPDTQGANPLVGTNWQLAALLDNQGQLTAPVGGKPMTAEFTPDRIAGSGGCNTYSAGYTITGDRLTISQAISTMMACPEPGVMEQEAAFLALLEKVAGFAITNGELALSDETGAVLLRYGPIQAAPLAGTNWAMTFYNNGKDGFVSALEGATVTAVFNADGTVNGSAGCNNFTGAYKVEGDNITIGPLASTRKACPEPGVMEQETAYLAALESAATLKIRGDQLELARADGARAASFVVRPGA
jgi:heat shock protein HslJ